MRDEPVSVSPSGFNNLSRTLTASFYYLFLSERAENRLEFLSYLDAVFSGPRLGSILEDVSRAIDATILFRSHKDYEPLGASATTMIAEESPASQIPKIPQAAPSRVVHHLDKSHLAIHTYPDTHPLRKDASFRVDLDLSTCGEVSPLAALDWLLRELDPDVWTVDLRVRGFTRTPTGEMTFLDEKDYFPHRALKPSTRARYMLRPAIFQTQRTFCSSGIRLDFAVPSLIVQKTPPKRKFFAKMRVPLPQSLSVFFKQVETSSHLRTALRHQGESLMAPDLPPSSHR